MKLYEAAEALAITDEWLEEHGGELTPELEAAIEQAEGDFATKVERVALKVKSLEAEEEAIGAEVARLAQRMKARQTGIRSLKTYLQRNLEAAGKDKVNGLLVTVSLQANAPSVQVAGELDFEVLRDLHPGLLRVVPESVELDKKAVKGFLEAMGKEFHEMPNGGTVALVRSRSLRIR